STIFTTWDGKGASAARVPRAGSTTIAARSRTDAVRMSGRMFPPGSSCASDRLRAAAPPHSKTVTYLRHVVATLSSGDSTTGRKPRARDERDAGSHSDGCLAPSGQRGGPHPDLAGAHREGAGRRHRVPLARRLPHLPAADLSGPAAGPVSGPWRDRAPHR